MSSRKPSRIITKAKPFTLHGHFAALEQPDALAFEVRAFFREWR